MSLTASAALLTLSQVSLAQDYKCVVERLHRPAAESDPVTLAMRKAYVGKEFTVDRSTGMMVGALKNSFLTKPLVVDKGSKDNSFKVVTTMRLDQGVGSGSTVFTLVVNEYVEAERKPFVFLSNDDVFFGSCIHFR